MFGQSVLFFAVANKKNCIAYIEYFVDVVGLDPRNCDQFNCSILHWAGEREGVAKRLAEKEFYT